MQHELQQLHSIYELSEAVTRAEALDVIYEVSLNSIRQVLQADRASILLYDADGVMRFKAWRNLSDRYRRATEGHTPWTADTPDARPILVNNVAKEPSLASLRAVIEGEGIRALAFVPLTHRGRVIGKFMVYYDTVHIFTGEEMQVAQTIAHHVAFAIERKRAEDQMYLNQQQLADFVENASIGLHWVGPDGRILWANQAELELLGYSAKEYIGRPIAEFHADEAVIADILRRLACGETLHGYEARLKAKDGSIKCVIINSNVLWKDGDFIHSRCFTQDVTELRRMEEAQAHLAAIVQSSDDAIIGKTLDATITSWNPAAERMYGYNAEEMIGQPVAVIVPPNRSDEVPAILNRIRRGERVEHFETQRIRKDGVILDVSLTVSPIYDGTGKLIGASKIARDITARKRGDQLQDLLDKISELLLSSVDYEQTMQSVVTACVPLLADWCSVHSLESDGRLHTVDRITEKPELHTTLTALRERYPFDPSSDLGLARVLRTGEVIFLAEIDPASVVRYAKSDEHLALLRQLAAHAAILLPLQARGRTLGVMSLSLIDAKRHYNTADVAVAKELARRVALALDNAHLYHDAQLAQATAERALERTNRLQAVTSALSSAATPEEVGNVVLIQGLSAFGVTAGTISRMTEDEKVMEVVYSSGYYAALVSPGTRYPLEAVAPLVDMVRTQQPVWIRSKEERQDHYSLPSVNENNNAWAILPLIINRQLVGCLSVSFDSPQSFLEEDQTFMLALAQQCAQTLERAQLYSKVQYHADGLEQEVAARTQELQGALLRAQNADRVKSLMLANVSHEMRTPLSSIIGFSNLLLTRDPDKVKAREYTSLINSEGRRLAQLIDDFLDLQQLEKGLKPLRCEWLDIKFLIEDTLHTYQLGSDNKHRFHLDFELVPSTCADEARLRQIVLNLLSNAVKYSPDGGEIVFSLRQDGNEVVFSVRDSGLGIPADEVAHLFEQFYRGSAAEDLRIKGTGLGLALSKEIVQAHGGRIWAESAGVGQGSTFSIALPIAGPESAA